MNWKLLVVLSLQLCFAGCKSDPVNDLSQDTVYIAETIEPKTGATLIVELDKTSIDLVDTVHINAVVQWDEGVEIELIEPDWDESGWTLESSREGVVVFDGDIYERHFVFVASPYLSGEYLVEGFGIRASSEKIPKRIARIAPIRVSVRSLLSESDTADLEPAPGLVESLSENSEDRMGLGIWLGLGIGLIGCGYLVWYFAKSNAETPEEVDPRAVLMIATRSTTMSQEDLCTLHRAMIQLQFDYNGIEDCVRTIEHERFAYGDPDEDRIRNAADRALRVCGVGA